MSSIFFLDRVCRQCFFSCVCSQIQKKKIGRICKAPNALNVSVVKFRLAVEPACMRHHGHCAGARFKVSTEPDGCLRAASVDNAFHACGCAFNAGCGPHLQLNTDSSGGRGRGVVSHI